MLARLRLRHGCVHQKSTSLVYIIYIVVFLIFDVSVLLVCSLNAAGIVTLVLDLVLKSRSVQHFSLFR